MVPYPLAPSPFQKGANPQTPYPLAPSPFQKGANPQTPYPLAPFKKGLTPKHLAASPFKKGANPQTFKKHFEYIFFLKKIDGFIL